MTLPILSITKNAAGGWDFSWAATTPPYRIVLCGVELAIVSTNSYTWSGGGFASYPPPIEVVDVGLALSEQFQPFLIMQWYGDESITSYTIQQSSDEVNWTTIQQIQEGGDWVYSYQTTVLIDGNTYYYRVFGTDFVGNQTPAREFIKYIVAPPPPPDPKLLITYSTPNVVIAHV